MANNDKKYIPVLRFPEFQKDGEWEKYTLNQIFSRITERNTINNKNVLTISAQYGLISQYDYFKKNIASTDVSKYYIISKDDFAYNKSKSQGYPYGAIKPLKLYDKGVVSPIYICFRIKDKKKFINSFFEYYFESELTHQEINNISQEGARNHGLLNIITDDFFNRINLYVPSPLEQLRIADCLISIDKQIDETKRKHEQLKKHKKGLMQRLFPIKGKITPDFRFPEFIDDGEWEEVTIGDCFTFIPNNTLSRANLNYENGIVQNIHYGDVLIKYGEYLNVKNEKIPFITDVSNFEKYQNVKLANGDIIIADTAEDETVGKCTEIQGITNEVIVSGLHTITISPKMEFSKYYLGYYMNSNSYREQLKYLMQGIKVLSVSKSAISKTKICFPSSQKEQSRIADCLCSLDNLISSTENKIKVLELHRKGLMQQLYPKL